MVIKSNKCIQTVRLLLQPCVHLNSCDIWFSTWPMKHFCKKKHNIINTSPMKFFFSNHMINTWPIKHFSKKNHIINAWPMNFCCTNHMINNWQMKHFWKNRMLKIYQSNIFCKHHMINNYPMEHLVPGCIILTVVSVSALT